MIRLGIAGEIDLALIATMLRALACLLVLSLRAERLGERARANRALSAR